MSFRSQISHIATNKRESMSNSTSKKSHALRDRFRPDGRGAQLGHAGEEKKEGADERVPSVSEQGEGTGLSVGERGAKGRGWAAFRAEVRELGRLRAGCAKREGVGSWGLLLPCWAERKEGKGGERFSWAFGTEASVEGVGLFVFLFLFYSKSI